MSPFPRLRSTAALLGVVAITAFGIAECGRRSSAGDTQAVITIPPPLPEPSTTDDRRLRFDPSELPKLSPALPLDLHSSDEATSPADHEHLAAFAWNTFVALNWPVSPDGAPDPGQLPGEQGDNATVWETWPEVSQIFRLDGRPPAPWGSPPDSGTWPAELRDLPPGTRVLVRTGKHLSAFSPDASDAPLVDQNGRHVRLEVRVNRPVFDTIVALQLFRRDEQDAAGPIAFPVGAFPSPDITTADAARSPGSIRVQAAWKVLSPAEIAAGRFHAVPAVLYTPPPTPDSGPGEIEHAIVGLVGLHIVRKTPNVPGWIWSTFEHVDNCPDANAPAERAAYNFYNKSAPALKPNQPPAPPWNPSAVEPVSRRPQIVRHLPIPEHARVVTAAYQAALRAINPASPWQNYQLIGVQTRNGTVASPDRLANTTLETYLAASAAPAASCIDCHSRAATTADAPADSVFLLRLAR
jgi:hypothetical protein